MDASKVSEYAGIENAVRRYVDGTAKGDLDLLKSAFDPNAVMYAVDGGKLTGGPIQVLFDLVRQLGGDSAAEARVDILSVDGTAAVATVVMEGWHGMAFTDYHNLLKIDGEWKIIAKTYQAH